MAEIDVKRPGIWVRFRPVPRLSVPLDDPIEQYYAALPEIGPLAATLNSLLARLRDAFEAERSFAANAAHELRKPLAGAIAQAQRLRSETEDAVAAQRATIIEETLKRLTRRTERLMQLARAEGGRLQSDTAHDARDVLRYHRKPWRV